MEFLEGETLAAKLQRGILPLKEALRIAIEIGEGLENAHRHGIVHRDLKPANVMLTTTGAAHPNVAQAKLLDFGRARLGVASGVMAPEQLQGQGADARSDIFAFGTMLYEMFTGRKAFEGRSQVR